MRSEEEILEFLRKCEAVAGFGVSKGPCPLKENEEKTCDKDGSCPYEDESIIKEMTPEDIKRKKEDCCKHRVSGCCAECSFPSTLKWVLGNDRGATDNGQKRLIKALRGEI